MTKNMYLIDPKDLETVEALIEAVNANTTPYEQAIRKAVGLHRRPFNVKIDYLNSAPPDSPMFDRFTFDMDTDDLILFTDEPPVLVDALLEMAMFMNGFNTLIGVDGAWKTQLAIGAWRRVRESLKMQLGLPYITGRVWTVSLNPEGIQQFDANSFAVVVALAGCADIEVQFPTETAPRVIRAYKHLSRIVHLVAQSLTLDEPVEFNRRLYRAITLIEDQIAPRTDSTDGTPDRPGNPLDDFFGSGPHL